MSVPSTEGRIWSQGCYRDCAARVYAEDASPHENGSHGRMQRSSHVATVGHEKAQCRHLHNLPRNSNGCFSEFGFLLGPRIIRHPYKQDPERGPALED